jgi:hypothetical protein
MHFNRFFILIFIFLGKILKKKAASKMITEFTSIFTVEDTWDSILLVFMHVLLHYDEDMLRQQYFFRKWPCSTVDKVCKTIFIAWIINLYNYHLQEYIDILNWNKYFCAGKNDSYIIHCACIIFSFFCIQKEGKNQYNHRKKSI